MNEQHFYRVSDLIMFLSVIWIFVVIVIAIFVSLWAAFFMGIVVNLVVWPIVLIQRTQNRRGWP